MPLRRILVCAFALCALAMTASAADKKLLVGIPPLDVATVENVDQSAGAALAKLIRIEMTKTTRLQPVLLAEAPKTDASADDKPGDDTPATPAPKVDVVAFGTVTAADAGQSSSDATSSSFLGGNFSVGGKLGRSKASVELHIELQTPAGDVIDTFDVDASASETGIGTDFQTAIGNFNVGDASFDKSPMGRALRGVAQKVAAEVVKRADKLKR